MSTSAEPTSAAQESPSRRRRFRSLLGLCIYWLVVYVLGFGLAIYVIDHIILGRTDRISDYVLPAASGLTGILIAMGLMELWRRCREVEAADESGVRSSSDAAVGSE